MKNAESSIRNQTHNDFYKHCCFVNTIKHSRFFCNITIDIYIIRDARRSRKFNFVNVISDGTNFHPLSKWFSGIILNYLHYKLWNYCKSPVDNAVKFGVLKHCFGGVTVECALSKAFLSWYQILFELHAYIFSIFTYIHFIFTYIFSIFKLD